MALNISSNLTRISAASRELNTLADEATAQVRALDEFLASLNAGIEVWADRFMEGREQNSQGFRVPTWYRIGYGRDDQDRFGLVIAANVQTTTPEGTVMEEVGGVPKLEVAWVRRFEEVRRDIRIAAIAKLADLVETIAATLEEKNRKLRTTMAEAKLVTNELKEALAETTGKPRHLLLGAVEQREIKALLSSGNRSAAVSRYQDLVGVTRKQAEAVIDAWQDGQ